MFLDALSGFVEQHKEYLDDFLFLMLLRLLHRQGTDMLSSVHYKLMAVLELIRKNFEPEQQFVTLGRILTDPQQPMSTKVKLAWMEYFLEVIAQMEPSDFKDDVGILCYPTPLTHLKRLVVREKALVNTAHTHTYYTLILHPHTHTLTPSAWRFPSCLNRPQIHSRW